MRSRTSVTTPFRVGCSTFGAHDLNLVTDFGHEGVLRTLLQHIRRSAVLIAELDGFPSERAVDVRDRRHADRRWETEEAVLGAS
jgi:hypothetical protein